MTLLRGRNVSFQENGQLTKCGGFNQEWDSCALLDWDNGDIDFAVQLVGGSNSFFVGIAQAALNPHADRLYPPQGYHVFASDLQLYAENGVLSSGGSGLPGPGLHAGSVLRVRFKAEPPAPAKASMFVSVRGSAFVKLPFDVIPGEYRPCLLMSRNDTTINVIAGCSEPDAKRCRTTLRQMWLDTAFSDCVLECGERKFNCHRAVLGTASPVWRAALEGDFRERKEAKIVITDVEPSVVESLLRYVYIGKLDGADTAAILPLAHRYDMPELVGLCVRTMVKQINAQSVAKVVSAVNLFSEHKEVAPFWPKLVDRVKNDATLLEAAMRCVTVGSEK
jgi:hypothetical protein